jgi:hypothetical protein
MTDGTERWWAVTSENISLITGLSRLERYCGDKLDGCWNLVAWRRVAANGDISFPLGKDAND